MSDVAEPPQKHQVNGTPAVAEQAHARSPWSRLWRPFDELPPAPQGAWARLCLALVALLAVAFTVYISAFLFAAHDAFLTQGEDLGIMDQALWNNIHGAFPLHQTICNIISDTNCLGDVSRFAIHFEPIMLPLSLVYLIAPSPKTLFVIQAAVVAAGAFPAFWIASRRLRSPLAGVAFAAIYLAYPALTAAVTFNFHAVTMSAAFIMFALYFMLTRNNAGLFIACLLALSTKEEVPLDVIMIGLAVLAVQRRWRVGAALIALSLAWVGLYVLVSHAYSPLGHSPTASRYAYLGSGPVAIAVYILTHPLAVLRDHIFDSDGRFYLRSLLSGAGYLPILGPLILLLAAPVAALNLLSSDPTMRSGVYQYNAEIVPFLVLAAIEGVALAASLGDALWRLPRLAPLRLRLAPAAARVQTSTSALLSRAPAAARRIFSPRLRTADAAQHGPTWSPLGRIVLIALTLYAFAFSLYEQRNHGNLPISQMLVWPQQTAHTRLADEFIKLIPADASVSAQATLIPHVSERRFIYQFPYRDNDSDYVFLDVTAFRYPYDGDTRQYAAEAQSLLTSPDHHVVAARDGYLLIARGAGPKLAAADPLGLPASFYTFADYPASATIPHPLAVRFGDNLELVGYAVTPTDHPHVGTFFNVVTYWRATGPVPTGAHLFMQENRPNTTAAYYTTFVATAWRPMDTWQPGQIYAVQTDPIQAGGGNSGADPFSLNVLDAEGNPLPATVVSGPPLASAPGGYSLTTVQVG